MSADSYHHLVECSNGKDFCDALESDGTLMVIKSTDFLQVPRGLSENSKFAENHPKMDVIRIAKFVRGSTKIFWKQCFNGEDFKSSEFMQKRLPLQH